MPEIQVKENGQIRRRNYDGEWETESEQESSDEESVTPLSEFYEAERHEFPRDVGIPTFWYNGEVYFWTNRNLRVFVRLVVETLDYLEAECDMPRDARPEGWDDWDFSFDRPIHPHFTLMIANDLQRRLNHVEFVRLGRIAPRGVEDAPPEDVQGTASIQPHCDVPEVPGPQDDTQPNLRPVQSAGRSGRTTTRRRAPARHPRGRVTQEEMPLPNGQAEGSSGSGSREEEEMVEVLLGAATDPEPAVVEDGPEERMALRPRASIRLPVHLNDYVRS